MASRTQPLHLKNTPLKGTLKGLLSGVLTMGVVILLLLGFFISASLFQPVCASVWGDCFAGWRSCRQGVPNPLIFISWRQRSRRRWGFALRHLPLRPVVVKRQLLLNISVYWRVCWHTPTCLVRWLVYPLIC
jgi:hypothetical protein